MAGEERHNGAPDNFMPVFPMQNLTLICRGCQNARVYFEMTVCFFFLENR